MYFVIAKLDATKLARMDFLVNFGVTQEQKSLLHDLIENGGDYDNARYAFYQISFLQLLRIYKYFSWADKKLH
jgi:hypothetical protein